MTGTEVLLRPADRARRDHADRVAIGGALLLVVAAVVLGYRLLAAGAPLYVQAPPLLGQLRPQVGPGTPAALALALLGLRFAPTVARRWAWPRLGPLAAVTGIAWTAALALVDGWSTGWAGRLSTPDEYLHDLPRIGSVSDFLAGFTRHILDFQPGSWTTHVSSHPPGATLVFLLLDRIGLRGGGWAGAVVIVVGATAGLAVALVVRELGAPVAARRMLPFAVFFPGAVWVGVSADGLFAGVAAWGVALAVLGVRRSHRSVALAGGLLIGLTGYLSYGLVLLGLVVLVAALLAGRFWSWLPVLAGMWLVAAWFSLAGFDWFAGERLLTIRYYQGIAAKRPYLYFVWANLAALVLSAGPVVAAGLRRAVVALGRRERNREVLVPAALAAAAAVAVLIADLTGLSKAETERIWLPFGCWLLPALALIPNRRLRPALALQIAVALLVNHLVRTNW